MANYLPLFIKTDSLDCLVVGGGKIALRKVLALLRFDMKITVVSEAISYGIRKLLQRRLIAWRKGKFTLFDLYGRQLVIAATNVPKTNQTVCRWARRFGILCNAVDDPEISGFIFPAVHWVDPLTIAVSTQGSFPALARKIKREIAGVYGKDYGAYIRKLCGVRQYLKNLAPDFQKRRRLLRRLMKMERQKFLDLDEIKLKEDLKNGLCFNWNRPSERGSGASGEVSSYPETD